jgi:hypothetical protein
MDPIRPKTTQSISNSFPIYYVLLIFYVITVEAHRKAVVGAETAYKGQKLQRGSTEEMPEDVNFCIQKAATHSHFIRSTPF